MKHTPGPWHICEATRQPTFLIRDVSGMALAEAFRPNNSRAMHIDPALNARLIASAPELLAALQNLLADKYLSDPINADRMAQARAAVAKALGH